MRLRGIPGTARTEELHERESLVEGAMNRLGRAIGVGLRLYHSRPILRRL